MTPRLLPLVVAAAVLAVACGGGGGGASAPAPDGTAAVAPTSTSSRGTPATLDALRQDLIVRFERLKVNISAIPDDVRRADAAQCRRLAEFAGEAAADQLCSMLDRAMESGDATLIERVLAGLRWLQGD